MFKGIAVRFAFVSAAVLILASYGAVASPQHEAADPSSFLERAVEMNNAEIQLVRLGMEKAQDNRVRSFAAMLVQREKAHAIPADAVDPDLLTPEHQQALERLSGLSGAQFDRQFLDILVSEHRRAVRMFEQEAGIAHRDNVRRKAPPIAGDMARVATDLLPMLKQHLSQAEDIQKQILSSREARTTLVDELIR